MTTEIPSHAQRMALYRDQVLARTDKLTAGSFQPGFVNDLIRGGAAALAEEADYRSLQRHRATFFGTAEGTDLDDLARDHLQLERAQGGGAIGEIQFTRASDAAGPVVIPALTLLETDEGIRFVTLEEVLLTGTTILADIQAVVVGEEGTVPANTITHILGALPDATITCTNPEGTAGGASREEDPAFRQRIRDFYATIRRGTPAALIFGAKITGVSQVSVDETSDTDPVAQTGISYTTVDSEVSGPWFAKGADTLELRLLIAVTAVLSNSETVSLVANLQDATSSGGAGAADFGTAVSSTTLITAPGSGEPHTLSAVFERVFDVSTARDFLRTQQTLTTSSTGTIIASATPIKEGLQAKVRVYVSDASGTANSAILDAVEAELVNWRSAGVLVDVLAAVVVNQDVEVSISFRGGADTSTARDGVVRAITDEVNRLSIGETLYRARLVAAAANVEGVLNVVINDPVGDVVPASNELLRTSVDRVTFA